MSFNDPWSARSTRRGELCLERDAVSLGPTVVTLEERVTELFVGQREALYRYVITIVGSPGESEEITQEAFIRLYCHLRAGNRVNYPRAWIFRTAHNLAINESTRKHVVACAPDWEDLCSVRQDPGPDPEQHTLQADKFARLLAQLSPQQRQCILLRADGFRYREIAEIMGIRKSTVQEFLRRAVQKLKAGTNV